MHQLLLGEKKLQIKIHYSENKVGFSYYFDYDYPNPEKKPQRKITTKQKQVWKTVKRWCYNAAAETRKVPV